MPTPRTLFVVAGLALASAAAPALAQTVRRGPVFNPATGSRYYSIEANFATARAWAQQRVGGDLATINDAAENAFVTANFADPSPQDKVQIGLNDIAAEGTFVWADASTSPFRNWDGGSAQSAGNSANADIVQVLPGGIWQVRPDGSTPYTLVETTAPLQVPGEFLTLRDAMIFANANGGGVIELGSGNHELPTSLAVVAPITVRGRANAEIRTPAGGVPLAVQSALTFENLAIVHRFSASSLATVAAEGSVTLREVTLRADAGAASPAVFSSAGAVRIERSVVRDVGAIVFPSGSGGSLSVVNALILRASAVVGGPTPLRTTVTNSTLVRVGSSSNPSFNNGATAIVNCVIAQPGAAFFNGTRAQLSYSLFPTAVPGSNQAGNNIVGVPQFVNEAAGDFRLLPTSPGIDAGSVPAFLAAGATSLTDLAGAFRVADAAAPNTGLGEVPIDMGAFEVAAPTPCRADFNNDTELTFDDIQAFVSAYNSGC